MKTASRHRNALVPAFACAALGFLGAVSVVTATTTAIAGVAVPVDSGREGAALQTCALSYEDLRQTARLRELLPYFQPNSISSFVNQTRGSYFEIDTTRGRLVMTFLTSGLFDMYLIERRGPIRFCDDGESLVVSGIEMKEDVTLQDGAIVLGRGGEKRTFRHGRKPELLERLHSQ